ncbi:MAG: DUF255 domain-containing protein [Candidatus Kapaibacterium sp.]
MMQTLRRQIPTLLLLLTLLLSSNPLKAEGIQFFDGTWEEAVELAAKENKYIMVDAYTDWCGWCKVQDKETFTLDAVGELVNANFVPIKVDFEKGVGIDLGMKFRVSSYPTILFFNPAGQLVHTRGGYSPDPQDFINDCNKALSIKEDRIYAFDSRDLTTPFPDLYRNSFRGRENVVWPEEEEVVAFLDKQEDLFDEVSWSVIWRFGGGEKYEHYLMANIGEYEKRYGSDEVRETARGRIQTKVFKAAQEADEEMMLNAVALLDTYHLDDHSDLLKLLYKQLYYERTEEWDNYAQVSEEIVTDENASANRINSLCWNIYEKIEDQAILAKATTWMKVGLEKEPDNWMYIDTYAALLYKTGNLVEAEKQARKAIQLGEEKGDDVSETKKLLEKITGKGVSGS